MYIKSLQDNLINKNENEVLCIIFTKYLDEVKNEFINMNIKVELNFFRHNLIKFQPRTEKYGYV